MAKKVEVAIIGAGSAGLHALHEVRKRTNDYIVIDEGPLGTTCARVGCMPSKALIQIANGYFRSRHMRCSGIRGGERLRIDLPQALAHVRRLRDAFTEGIVASTKRLGAHLLRGRASLIAPNVIRVGKEEFTAKRVVLAMGSRPIMPKERLEPGPRLVTTDTLFELKDLPTRIGVVGLGSVGLEMGQALSRLGCDVVAFDRSRSLGELADPAVGSYAVRLFSKEFSLHMRSDAKLSRLGDRVKLASRGRSYGFGLIVASLGRRPNLDSIGLEATGATLDERGVPKFDPETMQLSGLPIFIAGDASAHRAVLHEAVDDGRIAGYNSVHREPRRFERRAPMAITFSDPNIAVVGKGFKALEPGTFVTGEADFETQGRAIIMGEDSGLLHVYADARDGRFFGAEMVGPGGEHLAHLMAWALQLELTVFEMLRLPFYHPVLEEGLRTALRDAANKTRMRGAFLSGLY